MKELELIEKQEQSGNTEMYLIKVGMFYHAYNAGAYAIAKLMHYKIRRESRKYGDVLMVGFPLTRVDAVISKIKEVGSKQITLYIGVRLSTIRTMPTTRNSTVMAI